MRKVVTLLTAAAVVGLLFAYSTRPAHARAEYQAALAAKYEGVAEQVKEQKCGVCHGKQKTQRSEYAKALEKALGEKKVKDADKINAALDAVAAMEYADGKTYGDLLKESKLPAPFSE